MHLDSSFPEGGLMAAFLDRGLKRFVIAVPLVGMNFQISMVKSIQEGFFQSHSGSNPIRSMGIPHDLQLVQKTMD